VNQGPWLSAYPQGVPAEVNLTQYQSLVDLFDGALTKYAGNLIYSFISKSVSCSETERLVHTLASWQEVWRNDEAVLAKLQKCYAVNCVERALVVT
jgi:hypothetical protein